MADLLHPDAKLIDLGRLFECAKAEARSLAPERDRSYSAYTAGAASLPDYDDASRAAHRKLMRDCGYQVVNDRFTAKHSEAVRLMKAIHRAKATTLEGFAVKAAAVAFDQSDFEVSNPVPADVAERQMYRLARDMAKVARPYLKAHPVRPRVETLIVAHKAAWTALDAACEATDSAFDTDAEAAAQAAQDKASDVTADAIDAIIEHPYSSLEELKRGMAYLVEHHRSTGDGNLGQWLLGLACHMAGVSEEEAA